MLAKAISALISFYMMLIVVYCIMTWLPQTKSEIVESIRDVLSSVCDPFLNIFRGIIPTMAGMDFSPIVAVLALELLDRLVWFIL